MPVAVFPSLSAIARSRRGAAILGFAAWAAIALHGDGVPQPSVAPGQHILGDVNGTARSSSASHPLSSLDAATRHSISDAMRVARATTDRQGVVFTNPEQQLHATVESAGPTIVGRDGARVRFTHARLGRRQTPASVSGATPEEAPIPLAAAVVEGAGTTRATMARDAGGRAVTEWWSNSGAGIEQGFTIEERPVGEGLLTLEQTIDSALVARVSDDGLTATLREGDQTRLQFDHLRAWDRHGRDLPAHLDVRGDTLAMVVDDARASYPVTIDPTWTQRAYLKASNTGSGDMFGSVVAMSGDTLVVGANGESSNATGVNGNQANNSAAGAGAAYVFVRTGTTWTQQAYLKASNTGSGDFFGVAVAVSGDTIVVGAESEASNATGVNGNQGDNSAVDAGAAYVFVRTGTTWTQQAYLKASNTGSDDRFGSAVAVSGDTVVVGARREDSNATAVNGNQADNSASQAGAAYVFVRTGTTWTQQAYVKASNTGSPDNFGNAVVVSGDTLVVGAFGEASNATGVNGNQADNTAGSAGAAYVFVRTGTTWTQQAYVKASNTGGGDFFGFLLAVSGDTLVVGAPYEDSNATGVDGNQADNSAVDAGAAYVFVRTGTTWAQQAYLKASNTESFDYFGWAVAVSGGTVVVGAWLEDSNAIGVNGNQADNSAVNAGAAYVFVGRGATWTQEAYLKASNTGATDLFGSAVAMSGDTVVVGAYGEDSTATGVDGDQADNSASTAGAAYTFRIVGPAVIDLNADGNGDAFLWNPSVGNWAVQNATAGGAFTTSLGAWAAGWSVTPGKFNNDALTDLFLFNTSSGQWFRMLNNGVGGFAPQGFAAWGTNWQRFVVNLNGDGLSDVFLWDPALGQWFECLNDGAASFTYVQGFWSMGWEVYPVRFNTDAQQDFFLFNRSTGQWFQALGNAGGFTYPGFASWSPAWQFYPGDYDGDGLGDLLLHNPANGQFFVATTLATGGFTYVFGAFTTGYVIRPMDLDADGRDDLFMHNPTTGQWFEIMSNGAGGFTVGGSGSWSLGWQLYPTDFNGDGRANLLLYSPTGQWFQARNLVLGSFTYTSGFWGAGLTIIATP